MGDTSKGTIPSRFLNILHQEGHRNSIGFVVASSPFGLSPWFLFQSLKRLSHSPLGWEGGGGWRDAKHMRCACVHPCQVVGRL